MSLDSRGHYCTIALPLNGCLYPEDGEAKKLHLAAELLCMAIDCGRSDSYPVTTWIDSKDHLLPDTHWHATSQ